MLIRQHIIFLLYDENNYKNVPLTLFSVLARLVVVNALFQLKYFSGVYRSYTIGDRFFIFIVFHFAINERGSPTEMRTQNYKQRNV